METARNKVLKYSKKKKEILRKDIGWILQGPRTFKSFDLKTVKLSELRIS